MLQLIPDITQKTYTSVFYPTFPKIVVFPLNYLDDGEFQLSIFPRLNIFFLNNNGKQSC